MDFLEYKFGVDDADRRLDKVIRKFLPDHSLSEIYKLIRKGLIKINHKKTKENYHILQEDTLQIADFLMKTERQNITESSLNKPFNGSLSSKIDIKKLIVFQNEHLLILNKPYDIKVHGDNESLDQMVKNYYETLGIKDSLSFSPGPAHRLDRKTTGLLAFSMSLKGARWWAENIEKHEIKKSYLGIMEGTFTGTGSEKWIDFIEKQETKVQNSKGFHTVEANLQGKKAVTTAICEKNFIHNNIELTLTRFEIETGRTHQIRSQSAIHGFPLYGDAAYKSHYVSSGERDFYLHAFKLEFPENNPLGLPKTLECPPSFDIFK